MEPKTKTSFVLPLSVITVVDVGRLMREAEELDNYLSQAFVRDPSNIQVPQLSQSMDDLLVINKLNAVVTEERQGLNNFLQTLRNSGPRILISFGADPSPVFLKKIITWLRQEIHPAILLHIGLQPSIGAGCMVRTTNKYFDFSLRSRFEASRPILMQRIQSISSATGSSQLTQAALNSSSTSSSTTVSAISDHSSSVPETSKQT